MRERLKLALALSVFAAAAPVISYLATLFVLIERIRSRPVMLLTVAGAYTIAITLSLFIACGIPEVAMERLRLSEPWRYAVRLPGAVIVALWVHRTLFFLDGDETYGTFSRYLEALWFRSPWQLLMPLIFPAVFFAGCAVAAARRQRLPQPG